MTTKITMVVVNDADVMDAIASISSHVEDTFIAMMTPGPDDNKLWSDSWMAAMMWAMVHKIVSG